MRFHQAGAEIFVPDGVPVPDAIRRTTHLGIGAHQDDLEFMAFHGIVACVDRPDRWFGGITCTDGRGSARTGRFSECTDQEMQAIRRQEQNAAARAGKYGFMLQLNHPSSAVKSPTETAFKEDLRQVLALASPRIVYTHNPADKHDSHIGVVVAVLEVLREKPPAQRPERVIGCEVWRDLDWLPDESKVIMDVSGRDELAVTLNSVFESQIGGGKRYDTAIRGRRAANATFYQSHATDAAEQVIFGMDLTPLVADETLDLTDYVCGFVDAFKTDVRRRLRNRLGL
jgi:LmbE family N-acetylglucosaminyl deacetylase